MRAHTRARRRGDRGSQILEFAAYFPLFVLVATIALETFFAFIAAERMEHAARAGARVAGLQGLDAAGSTARAALPTWLDQAEVTVGENGEGGYYTEIAVDFPLMFPTPGFDLDLTRRVDMPL
ncbi:pilus assembly protein [Streptomonospora sp. S1-112]|uniref:Pilus assembly protein n=1 Tax=Streptomonospora mangrovi TaxID=2883123 RepID=A0A9X3NSF1_9ACTN|nr:TadE/TadG family type IV pilus assembly protein [Streptomonospora mangrovi]MDA0563241.1 pilus assembly protein [Streptomonospora mangrovi]